MSQGFKARVYHTLSLKKVLVSASSGLPFPFIRCIESIQFLTNSRRRFPPQFEQCTIELMGVGSSNRKAKVKLRRVIVSKPKRVLVNQR